MVVHFTRRLVLSSLVLACAVRSWCGGAEDVGRKSTDRDSTPGLHGVLSHPTVADPVWTQTSDAHFSAGVLDGVVVSGSGDAATVLLARASLTARWSVTLVNPTAEDLTDAPVPVELTGAVFDFAQAQEDGDDLRVLDSDGTTLLPFWIETWDAVGAQARLWVRIPALTAGVPRLLYLAAGDAAAGPGGSFDHTFGKDLLSDGLLARYGLDEGYGPYTADGSGAAHHGTLVNGPIWSTSDGGRWGTRSDVAFGTGAYLAFDGSNDYVEIPASNAFDIDQVTIAAWIQPTSVPTSTYKPILAKQNLVTDSAHDFVFMARDNSGDALVDLLYLDFQGASSIALPAPLANNSWHHVAVTVDRYGLHSYYLDGAPIGSVQKTPGRARQSWPVRLGARASTYWKGGLDDVRLYNRPLSAAEIQALCERRRSYGAAPLAQIGVRLAGAWPVYGAHGRYTSPALDTAAYPRPRTLEWAGSAPAGTSVGVQVRADDTLTGLAALRWQGPSGSDSDAYEANPAVLRGILANRRFLQYRLLLSSAGAAVTPAVQSTSLAYDEQTVRAWTESSEVDFAPYATGSVEVAGSGEAAVVTLPEGVSTGSWVSGSYDAGFGADLHALTWTAGPGAGGTIRVQLRSAATESALATATWTGPDGAGTYYTTPGQAVNASHDGQRYLQYRVILDAVAKAARPALDSIAITYTAAFTRPLTARGPAGTPVYTGLHAAEVSAAGEVDDVTIDLEAGMVVSLLLRPAATLTAGLEFRSPAGTSLGTSQGTTPGQRAVLQGLPVVVGGSYTVRCTGLAGTGAYDVVLAVNAVLDADWSGSAGNDTFATAQALAAGVFPLGDGATCLAVTEASSAPFGDDVYRLDLTAGERLYVALNVARTLELYDGTETLVRTGAATGVGSLRTIPAYTVPAAGTYYIRVAGASYANQALLVLRNAGIEQRANNDMASPEPLLGAARLIGDLTTADPDVFAVPVLAGDTLTLGTASPFTPVGEPASTLDPALELYRQDGTLIVADTGSAPDGRNALLSYTVTPETAGTCRLRVLAQSGSGRTCSRSPAPPARPTSPP